MVIKEGVWNLIMGEIIAIGLPRIFSLSISSSSCLKRYHRRSKSGFSMRFQIAITLCSSVRFNYALVHFQSFVMSNDHSNFR